MNLQEHLPNVIPDMHLNLFEDAFPNAGNASISTVSAQIYASYKVGD
jgi:hypothetical protein